MLNSLSKARAQLSGLSMPSAAILWERLGHLTGSAWAAGHHENFGSANKAPAKLCQITTASHRPGQEGMICMAMLPRSAARGSRLALLSFMTNLRLRRAGHGLLYQVTDGCNTTL